MVSKDYIEGAITQILTNIHEPDMKNVDMKYEHAYKVGWYKTEIKWVKHHLVDLLNRIQEEK